jgi:uncharacterized membrane protein (UPF0182 family)
MSRKRKKKISIIIIAVVALFVIVFGLNGFYIDFIWYKQLGYLQVFLKELLTKIKLIIPLFVLLGAGIYFLLLRVEKSTPKGMLKIAQTARDIKKKNIIRILISIVLSAISSICISNKIWYKLLEFISATDFGITDPIFGKEVSFYVFKLPFYNELLNIGFFLLFISAIVSMGYLFYLYAKTSSPGTFSASEVNIFEIKSIGKKVWEMASKYLLAFVCILFILIALSFYLKRFDLLYSQRGVGYGASFTDIKIILPLYWILSILSLLGAGGIVYFGIKGNIRNVIAIPVLLIIIGVLGNVAALVFDNYIVSPNQYQKELAYMNYNIEFTRKAYNVDEIEVKEFDASQELTASTIQNNSITINNIPINDTSPTLDMYNSLQGIRQYYEFVDVDVDRYYLNGQYRQVFVGAREMNNDNLADNAKTWINQHLKYTHGFGLAVSPVNEVTSVGQPALALKDIPPTTTIAELTVDEPRIYFGEKVETYAIVNTKTDEFDYPEGSDNAENQYDANTGLSLKAYNRIAFAINEGTAKILLSSDITSDSKILIRRDVMERVKLLAPFLSYDDDPYIVIANGKLYWIVEGYTITDRYPYSEPYSDDTSYNYMRNSVKAVVDAYTGEVNFYLIDETDPIANTYNKIYNGIFKSIDTMDEEIRAHLKYPQTYFDIQAEIYRTYHMTNTQVFYNKEDQWEVANQIYSIGSEVVPVDSAYTIMKLPGRDEEFLLMIPFTPRGKDNMIAWMAGVSDGDEYGKLIVYTFSKQSLVYGPMQMEKRIDQDTIIAPQLTLLSQQGSGLIRGNLMCIPIENNLIYVEPIYLQASSSGEQNIPELKKVIVAYEDSIVMADSLKEGLNQIFGKGASSQDQTGNGDITYYANQANELYTKAQEVLQDGDWAKYGDYMDQLKDALTKMIE